MEQQNAPDGPSGTSTDEMILRKAHLLLVRGQFAEARTAVEQLLARSRPPSRDAMALLEQIKRKQMQAEQKIRADGFWGELPGDLLRWVRRLLWFVGLAAVCLGVGFTLSGQEGVPAGPRLLLGLLLIPAGGALLFYLWRSRFVDDDDEREPWERLSDTLDGPPWY